MLTPDRLFRLITEMIFLLLGGLLVWLGLSGRLFFDRRSLTWVIASVALILWGLRALYSPGEWRARWQNWTRGLSLALVGVMMVAIARVPFPWVGPLLAFAGLLLMARGILGSFLSFRPR